MKFIGYVALSIFLASPLLAQRRPVKVEVVNPPQEDRFLGDFSGHKANAWLMLSEIGDDIRERNRRAAEATAAAATTPTSLSAPGGVSRQVAKYVMAIELGVSRDQVVAALGVPDFVTENGTQVSLAYVVSDSSPTDPELLIIALFDGKAGSIARARQSALIAMSGGAVEE